MIAILIFAGRSTRFWPLKEKSFFRIAGRTLLEEQVKRLKAAGMKNIVLVCGAHNKKEAATLFPGLKLVEQKDLDLGMRGALLSALPSCKKEAVMVVSANDVIETSAYAALAARHKKIPARGLLLARKVKTYFPGGYLSVKSHRITSIVEKPEPGTEPSDLVNIVAHVHPDASVLLEALKKVKPTKDDGYEVALDTLFKTHHYDAVPYEGLWQAVKYPWHLLDLLPVFLPREGKPVIDTTAMIHKTAVVEGPVVIGKNVKVLAHASVIGPCFIGDGSIVANNALVRGSAVGEDCVVGYSTEVCRSILGHGVWTHMSYVGDSVLADGVSLGGGTITGNLRLDEKTISSEVSGKPVSTERGKFGAIMGAGCRTGIHSAIAPGIKIGENSFINSATMVTKDIPNRSFVKNKGKDELDIRENKSVTAPERKISGATFGVGSASGKKSSKNM